MLLALALIAGWAGMSSTVAGVKGWPFSQLLLGNWGPAVVSTTTIQTGPGGKQYVVPNNPNQGRSYQVPGPGSPTQSA